MSHRKPRTSTKGRVPQERQPLDTPPQETIAELKERLTLALASLPEEDRAEILAQFRKARTPKARQVNSCLCGCGGSTASRFVPGHDSRLKSALLRAYRQDGLTEEQQQLVAALGWERFLTKPE